MCNGSVTDVQRIYNGYATDVQRMSNGCATDMYVERTKGDVIVLSDTEGITRPDVRYASHPDLPDPSVGG